MSLNSPGHQYQDWRTLNKSFSKSVFTKGFGFNTPQDGSVTKIKVFEDTKKVITGLDEDGVKEIIIGETDTAIDKMLELCIKTMKEEEICDFKFQMPSLDYSNTENLRSPTESVREIIENTPDIKSPDIEVNLEEITSDGTSNGNNLKGIEEEIIENDQVDTIDIKLQLLNFTREPEIWEMSITEKWRRASLHKDKGVELYMNKRYQCSFERFSLSLKYLISLELDIPPEHTNEEGMNIRGLKLSCYLNLAACQLKHLNYDHVITNCSKALQLQPNNTKALYRRGAALIQVQEYERAQQDLDFAQELDPRNLSVLRQQQILKNCMQKLNKYYASAMKKMFN